MGNIYLLEVNKSYANGGRETFSTAYATMELAIMAKADAITTLERLVYIDSIHVEAYELADKLCSKMQELMEHSQNADLEVYQHNNHSIVELASSLFNLKQYAVEGYTVNIQELEVKNAL